MKRENFEYSGEVIGVITAVVIMFSFGKVNPQYLVVMPVVSVLLIALLVHLDRHPSKWQGKTSVLSMALGGLIVMWVFFVYRVLVGLGIIG